ncbi:SDR family NAD(P)-dependent oxidoreductase [Pendulispora rubella]|uniref:SDR family NAD(P)-dependent oxidoreductase n=1 Tax=Pendulispora rubella TaxID=2741070 RepID=A0ABZ2LAR6_9BACT
MQTTSTRVLIIGGGFSGLGMAIRLLQQKVKDFIVLEKAAQLGGTWRENTYPGCACDVPSHLYSYSFAPKTDWSRVFAPQPEIQQYTLDVAARHGVLPYVHFGTEALRGVWDEDRQRWRVETNNGIYDAQFIVLGQGPLHEPRIPDLPGLDAFGGVAFHSAQWRHDRDLTGRRVAVIGTGSSAIQFVPHIQPKAERLVLFQRTAPWVLPKLDHRIPKAETWVLDHVPLVRRGLRGTIYALTEMLQIAQRNPAAMQQVQRIGLAHLRRQVRDPELRRALTPKFTLGCKRLLLSNTYYPALQAPNVEVVPQAVTEITKRGIVGADGIEREVDTIIFGTGFHVTDSSVPKRIVGRGGRTLDDVWRGSPSAYLGTTCHGFPNAFCMIGPNTGNGHGSAFTIIEAQARYIADAIATARREHIASIDVRPGAQHAWNQRVQAALSTSVFNAGGCASYYLDDHGKNSTIYPWTTIDMQRRMRRFDADRYELHYQSSPVRRAPVPIALEGAVVAITGGARGIGLATARRFVEKGAFVCIGDLDGDAAREAACTLGPYARGFELDVARRASFERFVAAVEAEVGPIEVLVNNAGVMPTGRFLEESDETDRAAMGVNHWGTSLGMKLVLPRMIARGRGHVVNVASLAGKFEVPWMATYVASKHATVGLTGAVRHEIDGTGVTLTAVMPAAIKTRLSAGIPLDGLFARDPDEVACAIVDSVRTRQPDVVVPRAFRAFVPLYAAAPRALIRWIINAVDSERMLGGATERARTEYETAVRAQGSGAALEVGMAAE